MTQHSWFWPWLPRRGSVCEIFPCKVTSFTLPPPLYYWEGSQYTQHTFKEWDIMLPVLEGRVSTYTTWDFPAWKACLFSHTYLFSYLFISVWLMTFILYLGYNPALLYFIAHFFSSFGYLELFHLALISLWHIPITCVCVCVCVSTFLLSSTVRCSRLISGPAPVLEPAISPRNSGSFYWRMVLETKIGVLGVLFAIGVL